MATNMANTPNPFGGGLRAIVSLQGVAGGMVAGHVAVLLEKLIKEELSKPGSGRIYKRGGRTHQASAPGEPPAVDLGDLRRSIGREQVEDTWRVGTGLARAAALEFGHRYKDGRVLAPRPYMRPAVKRLPEGTRRLVQGLQTATGRIAWPD